VNNIIKMLYYQKNLYMYTMLPKRMSHAFFCEVCLITREPHNALTSFYGTKQMLSSIDYIYKVWEYMNKNTWQGKVMNAATTKTRCY